MTLSLATEQKSSAKEKADAEFHLDRYLSGVLSATYYSPRKRTKKVIREHMAEYTKVSDFESPVAQEVISAKEASLKKEASEYGLKDKIVYAINESEKIHPFAHAVVPMVIATAVVGTVVTALDVPDNVASAVVLPTMVGSLLASNVAGLLLDNDIDRRMAYEQIKHQQLALKLLKKAIKEPQKKAEREADKKMVQECFARGIGNPGGVITSYALKNKGR